ncbi:Bug family tripartite tricarboxylate transporter substrate binding protein [Halorussus amylolyticus]|uniref:Bug family tripartite tricarboxylate transporter substrate binding protein n=1 Tax=Halorussus amylolyticus TaxID=1126242 RepID=UPI001EE470EC|nr:tripartite tricarboxylate transporter substrate binding protein [Halorussus amylolyticus]
MDMVGEANDTTLESTGRRRFLKAAGVGSAVGLVGIPGLGAAQDGEFPSGDIEMICPWAAGGGTDRTARQLASLAGEQSDASFFVTNQTGGSGSAGFRAAANAEPNGQTVGVLTVEICTISHLGIANITPDAFAPVMQYNFDPASLTVPEDAPYGTIEEFVSYAEENPGEVRISNSGIGAIWHLSAAQMAQATGIEVEHVGYDGGAPATQAVVNGEVEATTASPAEVAPQVQDGPLQMLAVFGEERSDLFPDVPTLQERDIDVTIGAWRGLGVPEGTPDERVQALNETFQSVYESDEFQSFMEDNGFGLVNRSPEEYGEFMSSELDRFEGIVDELDIQEGS